LSKKTLGIMIHSEGTKTLGKKALGIMVLLKGTITFIKKDTQHNDTI